MARYGGHPYDTLDMLPYNVVDPVKRTPLENLWALGHNRNELVWALRCAAHCVVLCCAVHCAAQCDVRCIRCVFACPHRCAAGHVRALRARWVLPACDEALTHTCVCCAVLASAQPPELHPYNFPELLLLPVSPLTEHDHQVRRPCTAHAHARMQRDCSSSNLCMAAATLHGAPCPNRLYRLQVRMEALICRNLDAALRDERKPYMFEPTAGARAGGSRSCAHCAAVPALAAHSRAAWLLGACTAACLHASMLTLTLRPPLHASPAAAQARCPAPRATARPTLPACCPTWRPCSAWNRPPGRAC